MKPLHRSSDTPASPRGRRFLLLLLLCLSWLQQPIQGQHAGTMELRVKAAYLIKFIRYTTWPENAFSSVNASFVLGVAGDEAMVSALRQESANAIDGHQLEIRMVNSLDEATGCHTLFIGTGAARTEPAWLQSLRKRPILTVGDSEHSIENGSVIRLAKEGKGLRFDVSRTAMEEAGLRISADMLKSARFVHNREGGRR